jgi:endonuclease YncB( thermonuclease family)
MSWRMRATVRNVHDGDTIYGDLDQGLGVWNHGASPNGMGLRIAGINARELADPGGVEARDYLADLVPVGTLMWVDSLAWDKYAGRIDVNVTLPDGRDLATVLVEGQWAAVWDGKGSRGDHLPPWPRTVA